jgi:GT2 family glycosyltransferase
MLLLKLVIVVPFYKNLHLVRTLAKNLCSLSDELKQINTECVFIDDSPDFPGMHDAVSRAAKLLQEQGIHVYHHTNQKNIGFVESTNVGMQYALDREAHCLLLNSDVQLSSGCLTEMLAVLEEDPMTAIVNPRTNNATICSLPFLSRHTKRSYSESLANFKSLYTLLPRRTFIPTGVGFCFLVKSTVLQEFELLDNIYSPGYNEENDYCMRVNRRGYRIAMANWAFAFHNLSSSFGSDQSQENDRINREKLISRYPEYNRLIDSYLKSASFKFELGLESKISERDSVPSLAVDLSHVRADHTGTAELGILFLHSLTHSEKRNFKISVIIKPEVAKYHRLGWILPEVVAVSPDVAGGFDVVVKPAQPFSVGDVENLSRWGLYNFFMMLDTIAVDCGYLYEDQLSAVWNLTARVSDGLIFISQFAKDQFNRRYMVSPDVKQLPLLLSLSAKDYLNDPRTLHYNSEEEASCILEADSLIPDSDFIFIVGNHFAHKEVGPTLESLSKLFPNEIFIALSSEASEEDNKITYQAGNLSQEFIDSLFSKAKFIVFPSHYEGFGFPIAHGLARGATVIARHSPVNNEIAKVWSGPGKLLFFSTRRDLQAIISELIVDDDEYAVKNNRLGNDSLSREVWNWSRYAESLISFINNTIVADPLLKKRNERIRMLELSQAYLNNSIELRSGHSFTEEEYLARGHELHERNLECLHLRSVTQQQSELLTDLQNSYLYKIGSAAISAKKLVPINRRSKIGGRNKFDSVRAGGE